MNQENWFCTPIWYEHTDIDTTQMAQKCLSMRQEGFANRTISNVGGWQSDCLQLGNYVEFEPIARLLDSKIVELQNRVSKDIKFQLDNIWINVNEKGHYNRKHIHGQTVFSGTFYIQVDDLTGNIRFHNDYTPMQHYPIKFDYSQVFQTVVDYKPKNGMLLIFPAWAPHEVLPSESDQPRISISFNIKQVN